MQDFKAIHDVFPTLRFLMSTQTKQQVKVKQ